MLPDGLHTTRPHRRMAIPGTEGTIAQSAVEPMFVGEPGTANRSRAHQAQGREGLAGFSVVVTVEVGYVSVEGEAEVVPILCFCLCGEVGAGIVLFKEGDRPPRVVTNKSRALLDRSVRAQVLSQALERPQHVGGVFPDARQPG